jgi:hypothetical protein
MQLLPHDGKFFGIFAISILLATHGGFQCRQHTVSPGWDRFRE